MNTTPTAPITVRRGTADAGYDETFEVPWTEGMSILDALMWVRSHEDASLAVRYSCINANACKECSVLVDGEIVYACTARLSVDGARVGPLPDKTLIRDLVTDIVPTRERLDALAPRKS